MKKRLISLLAMLAMLCTMVIVAMPTTVAADTYPAFSTYTAGSTVKEWSIKTPADWAAMRTVADAATTDYFDGYTFHLEGNVNFEFAKLLPMGNANTSGAAFAGTINGHGYGFENVNLGTSSNTKDNTNFYSAGLFFRLGDCNFIDFGLNSGIVYDKSGNVASGISSFGRAMPGKTPKFTRVWSSVTLAPMGKGTASGLVHTIDREKIAVEANGFVFDGAIVKNDGLNIDGQWSFGVSGSAVVTLSSGSSFANIVTDFGSRNGMVTPGSGKVVNFTETQTQALTPGVRAALFNFDTVANFKAANKGNIYAVKRSEKGIDEGYFLNFRSGYGGSGSEELMTDMTAVEAAWTINSNPTSVEKDGVAPVYYTLKDGKVRPIVGGGQDKKIIKVTLTGARQEEYFFNAGSSINLATDLGKKDAQAFAMNGSALAETTLTLGNEDIEITVTTACTHDAYDYAGGTNEHTKTCKACGIKVVEPCSADSYTQSIVTVDDLESGVAATHSGTCKFCTKAFTQNCDFTYEVKTKDYVWDYSCKCGRDEEITHEGFAQALVGDANGDGKIDLFDALRLLKKVVNDNVEINERNADVDGDNDPDIKDVRKMLLYYMNDAKIKAEFEATEERVNTINYYNLEDATVGNLKMDGSVGENDRYVYTDPISVSEGNKIVFGPVRMQQAVMGWFYEADGTTPLSVINRNNTDLNVIHEFADADGLLTEDLTDAGGKTYDVNLGMVMVEIDVPADAAYVRFNVNAEEKSKYYIRINNDFTVFDYENVTKAQLNTLGNPLKNQLVLNMGDSLSDGTGNFPLRDPTPDARLTCWSRRTKQQFGAKVITSAKGGSTVSTIKYQGKTVDPNGDLRDCILNQLNEHSNSGRQFEYILLEGGGNDAGGGAAIGTFKENDYNPNNFDAASTYSGALERLIYTAIQQHGDTAALGYFIPYDMQYGTGSYDTLKGAGVYFQRCREICAKWGIPVCDLFDISHEKDGKLIFDARINTEKGKEYFGDKFETDVPAANTSATGMTYDGVHATDEGHDIMFTYIKPFMLEMKPVSAEIYAQVQDYGALPTQYLKFE